MHIKNQPQALTAVQGIIENAEALVEFMDPLCDLLDACQAIESHSRVGSDAAMIPKAHWDAFMKAYHTIS